MMINYSLIFVSLLLFAGLAVDAGMLERSYLQLQSGAQAAAAGSSVALQRGGSAAAITAAGQAAAAMNGFANGVNGVSVTIANPPGTGSYANNTLAVLATVTEAVPTTFLGILRMGKVNLQARAQVVTPTQVSLSSAYNVNAIYTDGTTISNGGFDGNGYAYSANQLGQVRASNNLGALQSWRGNLFTLGPPNVLNGVANTTINLPNGNYSQILLLAAAAFGPILNVNYVVTYADGSQVTSTFSMSDWCNYQALYNGETVVSQETYRDAEPWGASSPGQSYLPTDVFGYTINLDNTKTLSTLKLPANRNVVVLALDLQQ